MLLLTNQTLKYFFLNFDGPDWEASPLETVRVLSDYHRGLLKFIHKVFKEILWWVVLCLTSDRGSCNHFFEMFLMTQTVHKYRTWWIVVLCPGPWFRRSMDTCEIYLRMVKSSEDDLVSWKGLLTSTIFSTSKSHLLLWNVLRKYFNKNISCAEPVNCIFIYTRSDFCFSSTKNRWH